MGDKSILKSDLKYLLNANQLYRFAIKNDLIDRSHPNPPWQPFPIKYYIHNNGDLYCASGNKYLDNVIDGFQRVTPDNAGVTYMLLRQYYKS
jgi:hypothetical protein